MKSFLLREKTPVIKWGMLPDNTYFEGEVPEGYSLAISPSKGYIVVDVDRHGDINGANNIPKELLDEMYNTLNYGTKNNGSHHWFKYSGTKVLANKTSGLGIDLRTHKGYVVWYKDKDIREYIHEVQNTSPEMNTWLESLFSYC